MVGDRLAALLGIRLYCLEKRGSQREHGRFSDNRGRHPIGPIGDGPLSVGVVLVLRGGVADQGILIKKIWGKKRSANNSERFDNRSGSVL